MNYQHTLTPEQAERARNEFQRVLDEAVSPFEFWKLGLLDESDEDYIQKEVDRKLYEASLRNGGDFERNIIKRLKKLSQNKELKILEVELAERALMAWMKVLPQNPRNPGYYYVCRPLKPAQNKDEWEYIIDMRAKAERMKQWEKKWFAQLLLNGAPELCADFVVECFYLLKCADGNISRQVQLTNVLGETTGKVLMDSTAFHAPKNFREWCLMRGGFNWGAGEKEIQKLHLDIARLAAWKTVNQIVTLGWFPLTKKQTPDKLELNGIWFFGDCAWINEHWATADADGIYWHTHTDTEGNLLENGYQVSSDGRENPFHQKKPLLHPSVKITDVDIELEPMAEISFAGQKKARKDELPLDGKKEKEREEELYRAFFRELCLRLKRIAGSDDAMFLIGSFLSFGGAPEFFEQLSQFPGLWTHGEANSGKSTIIEWLMEIWGFRVPGINLKGTNSTAVGLLQAADQYSNLPVWCDEFRDDKEQVGKDKLAVLHNAFNRGGQAKFNPSGIQRSMRTTFIVSGESTTSESAIRGRYPHIQISKHLRQGSADEKQSDFHWFNKHRKYFFFFGRYIIENRAEFVRIMQRQFDIWGHKNIDPRLRVVHGIGYAAWQAMVGMLMTHSAAEVAAFEEHMVEHSKLATEDVQSDLNVNVFIQDLIVAYNAGQIPNKCFRVESQYMNTAPNQPGQLNWESYTLYINPEDAIAALQIYLRKQNQSIVLKRKDLRDQLSKNDFWVNPPEGKKLYRRFQNGQGRTAVVMAWGIRIDLHPLGYQEQSDETMAEASKNLAQNGDPRKGPLFQLVEGVLQSQKEAANDDSFEGASPK